MSHEAGSHYNSLNILQMLGQGPEKTIQRVGMSHWGNLRDLSHSYLSESHQWNHHSCLYMHQVFYPTPHVSTFFSPSVPLSAALRGVRGSRLEAEGFCGMRGPAPGLDQSALQRVLLFGVCVFPREASGLPPTPCPLSKTHTEMYTEHKFMWVQCAGWQPKSALNQRIWTLKSQNNPQNLGTQRITWSRHYNNRSPRLCRDRSVQKRFGQDGQSTFLTCFGVCLRPFKDSLHY